MEGLSVFCCVDGPLWCLFKQVFLVGKALICSSKGVCVQKVKIFASSYAIGMHVSHTFLLLGCLLFWLSILVSLGRARREGMKEERQRDRESKRDGIFSAD